MEQDTHADQTPQLFNFEDIFDGDLSDVTDSEGEEEDSQLLNSESGMVKLFSNSCAS